MDKIQSSFVQVKTYISEMPPKRKYAAGGVILGIILFAILITILLNSASGNYTVLYAGMEPSEVSEVYASLKNYGADTKLNANGEIMVPTDEYDTWLLQMAAEGYPRTVPTYDITINNSGMTSTETEREQLYNYQLQERAQVTLKRIDGVSDAIVTINMPKDSSYIWEEATNESKGSVSVLLTLQNGVTLDESQVVAIKNLVAFGLPNMSPEDVIVVDAGTSLELGVAQEDAEYGYSENFELEAIAQRQLESNIIRLLEPRYGVGGVVATAKVTIDFDKMMTEQLQLQENPSTGEGFVTDTSGEFIFGENEEGDVVGEENNTDIPDYSYVDPDLVDDASEYRWDTQIDYSYIKTQIESGDYEIERATISVLVNEENLTQARQDELISLVSNSVDIEPDLITVAGFSPVNPFEEDSDVPAVSGDFYIETPFGQISLWLVLAVLLALFLIILIIIVIKVKSYKKQRAEAESLLIDEKEAEIEKYKQELAEGAKDEEQEKTDAVIKEIRDLSRVNPESVANLLRTWLKEDQ